MGLELMVFDPLDDDHHVKFLSVVAHTCCLSV